jgi:hypothetical protein
MSACTICSDAKGAQFVAQLIQNKTNPIQQPTPQQALEKSIDVSSGTDPLAVSGDRARNLNINV